ncbi:hypothetical protein GCM10025859_42390 [Alicyclobacillus fastidiosus]|nr:hypothetical protein GCM10025859_42390 [Alicyclobacillus fastidiosus]
MKTMPSQVNGCTMLATRAKGSIPSQAPLAATRHSVTTNIHDGVFGKKLFNTVTKKKMHKAMKLR